MQRVEPTYFCGVDWGARGDTHLIFVSESGFVGEHYVLENAPFWKSEEGQKILAKMKPCNHVVSPGVGNIPSIVRSVLNRVQLCTNCNGVGKCVYPLGYGPETCRKCEGSGLQKEAFSVQRPQVETLARRREPSGGG
jgi:hypothetical protein